MHTYGKRVHITVPAIAFILRQAIEHGPSESARQVLGAVVTRTKAGGGPSAVEVAVVMRLFREVAGQDVSESTAEKILVFLSAL